MASPPPGSLSERPSARLLRLFRQVGVPGQPPLYRERMHAMQKTLKALEVRLAFPRDQRVAMARSGVVPAAGHFGSAGRYVLRGEHPEAGLPEHRLVRAR